MAVKYTNNAKSTLASGINSSVTSATVADGSIFPALGAGEYFYITFDDGSNNEIAKVTARSGNTLTIVRAQDNTTARAFSTGDSAELRIIAAVLTEIQENIAAKSANQTVYSATAASNATAYNIGVDPGVEANASVFLDGVYQHHDTFSFSGSTLTFDAAPTNGTKIEVVVDNLINLQSSNLTVDTFTATSGQTAFTLSDAPGGEANVLAFIDGVFQNQAAFTLSSNTLTFDTGVVVGRSVTVYTINPVNIGTPSDSTVTSAKLTGNITLPGSLTVGAYDVAFDSPTFFVDHTNSRVGLGTSSPSVPVDIVGEAKISSHFTFADDAELRLGNSSDVKFKHHNSGYGHLENTGILYVDSEQIIFRTDNSSIANALTLDASHNATFHGDIIANKNLRLYTTDDQAQQWYLYTHTDDNFRINYNGAGNDALVIDTSENFTFNGAGTIDSGSQYPTLTLKRSSTASGLSYTLGLSDFTGGGTDLIFDGVGASTGFGFRPRNSSGSQKTALIISPDGNVAVGANTSPENLLHIYKGDSGSTYSADGADQLILENSDSVGMDIRTPSSNTGLLLFSDNDARGRGQLAYFHSSDAMAIYTAGAEVFRWDSSGNILMQNGSPEFHFGTSSASHANWRVAVQEVVNQGFEIASGTTSAGANALSDTYTTRLQITNDGEVKLPGTTAHTYLHIAANSGVGAANKYTSGSTTFTAGMDTAAGVPDNMYGITSGSSGSSVKALVADSTGRVGISHSNPNGLGRLSVHGTVGHGNVIGDPDISRTYTNVTAVDGSTIELVSATAFTVSAGDTCVVTWNKGSWASVMYDAQIAFASGGAHQTGSFYHNNSGSAWSGHVVKEHYDNTGRTWINYGGSNQTVIWTFDFPGGYHPILRLKITAGGGSGYVAANEFSVVWTT